MFCLCDALVEASLLGCLARVELLPETVIIAVFCLFIMSCDVFVGAYNAAGLLVRRDEETAATLLFYFLGQNIAD